MISEIVSLVKGILYSFRLSRLIASKNKLHSLPLTLFHNPYICTLDFYKNKLRYLPPEENSEDFDGNGVNIASTILWSCKNLRTLKLANNELARIPKAIHGASKLENLNVSNNELISFVKPWNCPMVCLALFLIVVVLNLLLNL